MTHHLYIGPASRYADLWEEWRGHDIQLQDRGTRRGCGFWMIWRRGLPLRGGTWNRWQGERRAMRYLKGKIGRELAKPRSKRWKQPKPPPAESGA